ncbi:MAG TPA: hypothetical protein VL486_00155 [Verrucomicrobiae bacterium]|nr:hypothetical protein [Verrucomicrobiae bacterium]
MAVQNANQPALLASDGVLGVGVGATNGSLAITVLVDNTNRAAQLPSSLGNLPVSVVAVGTIRALACGGSNPQSAYSLPVPLGVSGGNALLFGSPASCASGTIGFKVRDNASGVVGWISNNHVVGHGTDGCPNSAPVGTPQYQPGPVDTTPACSAGQLIGTLNRVVNLVFGGAANVVDVGFVQSSDVAVSANILNLGPQVNNVVPPFIGQVVRKNGRTSGCTEGTVTGINMTIDVDYSEGGAVPCTSATFTNQIMVSPTAPSTTMGQPGDSGSPVVDANNNAVGLLFAADGTGNAMANPMSAVLSALNVSLSSLVSSQVVTRTARFWFTHGYSSDTNAATLLKAIAYNGGAIDLGFITLATANRDSDNVIDANDAFMEALSFYWQSKGKTGEDGGTQSAKLEASSLCTARKKLAVQLIAATANTGLLGTWPPNSTYVNRGAVTNFPADLISQAASVAAGGDLPAIHQMTVLLRKFNRSGITNNLPFGLVEISPQSGNRLRQISRDPTLKSDCPGINDTCDSALPLVNFPFKASVDLTQYANSLNAPSCSVTGHTAVWSVAPPVAAAGRQFLVNTDGSNFDTAISVREGGCGLTDEIAEVGCSDSVFGVGGEQLIFSTDGTNTYYIVVQGKNESVGRLKVTVRSF